MVDTDGICGEKLDKGRTGHFAEQDSGKQKVPTKDTRAADRCTHVLKRT